jgi:hypothetical protein
MQYLCHLKSIVFRAASPDLTCHPEVVAQAQRSMETADYRCAALEGGGHGRQGRASFEARERARVPQDGDRGWSRPAKKSAAANGDRALFPSVSSRQA